MRISDVRQIAEFGNSCFQFLVGFIYEYGVGVPRHRLTAMEWYERAAEQGHLPAQYALGHIAFRLEKDLIGSGLPAKAASILSASDKRPLHWWTKAAEAGFAPAQHMLGNYYFSAGPEADIDHGRAAKWFQRAADQGYILAIVQLASCYEYGHGVERDEEQEEHYRRLAAEKGDAACAFLLGNGLVEKGDKESVVEGLKWIKRAAASNSSDVMGSKGALDELGQIYSFGQYGNEPDQELADLFNSLSRSITSDE